MTAEVPLTRGYVALVDDADFDRVIQRKWRAIVRPNTVYAQCSLLSPDRGKSDLLHRFVLGVPFGVRMTVDHINGDGLDNRRSNLRLCTYSQNTSYRCRPNKNNTSGYKGVIWTNQHKKWIARIGVRNTRIHLGLFGKPEDAARAYDLAAISLHGEFASLNFPIGKRK